MVSNERLEFLGDAVLGLIVCEYLYTKYPERAEGELAKAKAVAVSEPILADATKQLGLDQMILMSTGEEASGGRRRLSILSDAFEALVAVIYLDAGLASAKEFCLHALEIILEDIERQEHIRDYKSLLQELTQGKYKKAPKYVVIKEDGADHDKTFYVEARLEGEVLGCGVEVSSKNHKDLSTFDLGSLRWKRVIICTDADYDGYQIRTLILTMIYRLVPTLIQEGYVYIAESPLFEIECKNKTYFAYSEREKAEIISSFNGAKYTISRSKGLGENDPEMMWMTTMNPETRRLIKVMPTEPKLMNEVFELFEGDNLSGRKDFISENGYKYLETADIS
jgi:ribonuclease III